MNKKKKIAIITSLSLSTIVMVSPIAMAATKIVKLQHQNFRYSFMGNIFDSKNDAIEFGIEIANKTRSVVNEADTWTLNGDNTSQIYNSPSELINTLSSHIKTLEFVTNDKNLTLNRDGSLIPNELKKIDFKNNYATTTIYRGANNGIYKTEQEAKDSYYEIHQLYYFNNLFFRSKNELAVYLEKNLNLSSKVVNSIVLKGMNNIISLPISIDKLKTDLNDTNSQTYQYLSKFIRQNARNYIEYKQPESFSTTYYGKEEIKNIGANQYDPSYTQVTSNQGKGNYIVDLDKADEFDLLGPYYLKSSSDIKKMKDPSLWQKISGRDSKFVDNALEKENISRFFDTVISRTDDKANTFINVPSLNDEISTYFQQLRNDLPHIYDSLDNIYQTMRKGKKYSEFLKLPILFAHTIDQMVNFGVNQTYIDSTRKIYTKIAQYYDYILKLAVPQSLLIGKYGDSFSFNKIFKFDNKTLDLNYDIDTIISNISNDYPKLCGAINYMAQLAAIMTRVPFLKPSDFNKDYVEKLFNMTIEDDDVYGYQLIWDAFTCAGYSEDYQTDYNYLLETVKKIYATNDNNKLPNITDEKLKELLPYLYVESFFRSYGLNVVIKKIIAVSFGKDITFTSLVTTDELKKKNKLLMEAQDFIPYYVKNPQMVNEYNNPVAYYELAKRNFTYMNELISQNDGEIDMPILSQMKLLISNSSIDLKNIFGAPSTYDSIREKVNATFMKNIINVPFNEFDSKSNKLFSNILNSLVYMIPLLVNELEDYKEDTSSNSQLHNVQTSCFDNNSGVVSLLKTIGDIVSSSVDTRIAIEETSRCLIKKALKGLSLISKAMPWVSIAIDVIGNFFNMELTSYKFKTEDAEFIWNGGKEVSFLFGLIPGGKLNRGPEAMKLLDPIEIVRANVVNGYYYNGIIFNDIDTLRNKQLDDILENRYQNDKVKTCYSLLDLSKENNVDDYLKAPTLDKLVQNIINHIKTMNFNNLDKLTINEKKLFAPSEYIYGNGFKCDTSLTIKENIKRVLDTIKPVSVVQLPVLNKTGNNARVPEYNNNLLIDPSMKAFEMPADYWTSNGGLQKPTNNYNYIIIDPNSNGNTMSEAKIKKKLDKQFYKSFDVMSKKVNPKFLNQTTKYSDLSDNIIHHQAFIAENDAKEERIFLDKNDAISWLMKEFDYKAYFSEKVYETYQLDGRIFHNRDDFVNWICDNIKEVK